MNTPEGTATMGAIASMNANAKLVWQKIAEKGGDLPADNKLNLQNMGPATRTIKQSAGDGTLWGTLYDTSHQEGRPLASVADYMQLANDNDSEAAGLGFSFGTVLKRDVTGYSFGAACSFAPNNFCRSLPNLSKLEHTEVLQEIASNFLWSSQSIGHIFNQPLSLSNVRKIGSRFLHQQQAFSSPITLGNRLKSIGEWFMNANYAFVGPLTLPASLVDIGIAFMFQANNFTGVLRIETVAIPDRTGTYGNDTLSVTNAAVPAYAQGVRITGPGAAAWKAALPDRTGADGQNRRRKLILVEE